MIHCQDKFIADIKPISGRFQALGISLTFFDLIVIRRPLDIGKRHRCINLIAIPLGEDGRI
jgi:hypothetical protein